MGLRKQQECFIMLAWPYPEADREPMMVRSSPASCILVLQRGHAGDMLQNGMYPACT